MQRKGELKEGTKIKDQVEEFLAIDRNGDAKVRVRRRRAESRCGAEWSAAQATRLRRARTRATQAQASRLRGMFTFCARATGSHMPHRATIFDGTLSSDVALRPHGEKRAGLDCRLVVRSTLTCVACLTSGQVSKKLCPCRPSGEMWRRSYRERRRSRLWCCGVIEDGYNG